MFTWFTFLFCFLSRLFFLGTESDRFRFKSESLFDSESLFLRFSGTTILYLSNNNKNRTCITCMKKTEKFLNKTSSQEMYRYFSWFTDYLLNQLLFFWKLIAYWSLIEIVISACLSIITVLLLIIATGYLNSHITRIM